MRNDEMTLTNVDFDVKFVKHTFTKADMNDMLAADDRK